MKQDEGTFWLRWKATSQRREVAHPVASASTVTDEASYGRDREGPTRQTKSGYFTIILLSIQNRSGTS
jgi:hypothetical protein